MVYSCDRRYSEMSRREIDILMNDRCALLCVFTVSVALIGSDLLLLLLFVLSCDFLSDRLRVELLDRTVTV